NSCHAIPLTHTNCQCVKREVRGSGRRRKQQNSRVPGGPGRGSLGGGTGGKSQGRSTVHHRLRRNGDRAGLRRNGDALGDGARGAGRPAAAGNAVRGAAGDHVHGDGAAVTVNARVGVAAQRRIVLAVTHATGAAGAVVAPSGGQQAAGGEYRKQSAHQI